MRVTKNRIVVLKCECCVSESVEEKEKIQTDRRECVRVRMTARMVCMRGT